MKKCDTCRGTGLSNIGGLYYGFCPNCKGSGWVDDKIQGPPPKKKKETPAPAPALPRGLASGVTYIPGDIHECADGRIYVLSEKGIWELDANAKAPAKKAPAKKAPKKETPATDRPPRVRRKP